VISFAMNAWLDLEHHWSSGLQNRDHMKCYRRHGMYIFWYSLKECHTWHLVAINEKVIQKHERKKVLFIAESSLDRSSRFSGFALKQYLDYLE